MNAFEPLPQPTPELAQIAAIIADPSSEDAGRQLYRLVRDELPAKNVLAVGSELRGSVLWLAAALRDRGAGQVEVVARWPQGMRARLEAGLGAAALTEHVRLHDSEPLATGLGWRGERGFGLLHLSGAGTSAQWRDQFEAWSRFVVDGGFLVIDGAGLHPAPSQLAMNLPRWWRWTGSCHDKWVFLRCDEAYPPRRSYGAGG